MIRRKVISNPSCNASDIAGQTDLTESMIQAGIKASAVADEAASHEFHLGRNGLSYRRNRVIAIFNAMIAAGQAETAPDSGCLTQEDGECISTDPRCMHFASGPGHTQVVR